MISAIEKINSIVLDELVGHACYVQNDNGDMDTGIITRVDMFISKHGVGIRAHLKQKASGTLRLPLCVTLHGYNYNIDAYPVGFLSPWEYAKFYSELG